MLPDKDIMCHHTGFQRSCREIVTTCTCPKWVALRGKDPSSEKELDIHGCVDSLMPKLMLEQAQKMWMMGASVDEMKNEIISRMDEQKARAFYPELNNALGAVPLLKRNGHE